MIARNDRTAALYVVDFGLAASMEETREGRAAGTVPYMAPELFCGSDAREASDIFAVALPPVTMGAFLCPKARSSTCVYRCRFSRI